MNLHHPGASLTGSEAELFNNRLIALTAALQLKSGVLDCCLGPDDYGGEVAFAR